MVDYTLPSGKARFYGCPGYGEKEFTYPAKHKDVRLALEESLEVIASILDAAGATNPEFLIESLLRARAEATKELSDRGK